MYVCIRVAFSHSSKEILALVMGVGWAVAEKEREVKHNVQVIAAMRSYSARVLRTSLLFLWLVLLLSIVINDVCHQ